MSCGVVVSRLLELGVGIRYERGIGTTRAYAVFRGSSPWPQGRSYAEIPQNTYRSSNGWGTPIGSLLPVIPYGVFWPHSTYRNGGLKTRNFKSYFIIPRLQSPISVEAMKARTVKKWCRSIWTSHGVLPLGYDTPKRRGHLYFLSQWPHGPISTYYMDIIINLISFP